MNGADGTADHIKRKRPQFSNVESIFLRRSPLIISTLKSLVGACKALREFEYLRGIHHMFDDEMMPRDILEALLPHADSLEYLHINCEEQFEKNQRGAISRKEVHGLDAEGDDQT